MDANIPTFVIVTIHVCMYLQLARDIVSIFIVQKSPYKDTGCQNESKGKDKIFLGTIKSVNQNFFRKTFRSREN